ncbi:uncharacterized protein L201_003572 [Kwoniella dendrophila CBS 6074]|uniref:Transcription factor TFIIIC triple barrel domain-containing protein n=1 Tax=Kwoniella dendrophila CBS 6074 TaxID=1295534 RepID=A0AAX4JV33_9TREE
MLQSSEDALRFLAEGETLFGDGWTHVNSFEEIDEDEYEEEEEEIYVTMDLGTTLDAKALQNESQYQLVGLDTPLPFLKVGNQVFQGQSTPLIGDEVILGLIRNSDNPHEPTHPPLYSTNHRLTFRAITLEPRPTMNNTNSNNIPFDHPSVLVEGEAGPGPTTSSNNQSVSEKSSRIPRSSMKGSRGSIKGRPKGTHKARLIIDKLDDLRNFDLNNMKTSQKVELGPDVIRSLGLPPSDHGENLTLTRSMMSKVITGYPSVISSGTQNENGQPGSSTSVMNEETPQRPIPAQDDIRMLEETTNSKDPAQSQLEVDEAVIDVEDDPPWAEIVDGELPP